MSVEMEAAVTPVVTGREGWDQATDHPAIHNLRNQLRPAQQRVLDHSIYREINTLEDLITFTEFHVFAVWDFMCLLKSLQRRFTCVDVPWLPSSSSLACRLINEIVLGEESDNIGLEYMSHFDLYVAAMDDLGANTGPIRDFIRLLRDGVAVSAALDLAGAPAAAAVFVRKTWEIVERADIHEIAAAFALTREDLIPQMFERVVSAEGVDRDRMRRFVEYLERHIQVDAEEHTPMAFELLVELCGEDRVKWEQCASVSLGCFDSRHDLWTGVVSELSRRRGSRPAHEVLASLELGQLFAIDDVEVVVKDGRVEVWTAGPVSDRDRPHLAVSLPAGVRAADVSAVLEAGVLEIRAIGRRVGPVSATRVEVQPR